MKSTALRSTKALLPAIFALFLLIIPVIYWQQLFISPLGWWAAGGGLILGVAVGIITAKLRLRWWGTILLAMVSYLLVGPFLAQTGPAGYGQRLSFQPSLNAWVELVIGTVAAWKSALTMALPLTAYGMVAVLPVLVMFLTGILTMLLATRTIRWQFLTPLPSLVALILAIAWGSSQSAQTLYYGAVWVALALIWWGFLQRWQLVQTGDGARLGRAQTLVDHSLSYGESLSSALITSAVSWRSLIKSFSASAIVIVVFSLFGGIMIGLVGPFNRNVIRDHIRPPVSLENYISPLAYFRDLSHKSEQKTLFEVDGYQKGQRIRLATMDIYTGTVFAVEVGGRTKFYSTTGRVNTLAQDQAELANSLGKSLSKQKATITIGDYAQPWLPLIGKPRSVRLSGLGACENEIHFSDLISTGYCDQLLNKGLKYQVDYLAEPEISDRKLDQAAFGSTRYVNDQAVPSMVQTKALELTADAATPKEKMRALEQYLHNNGFYSDGHDGLSQPGHRASRIERFFDRKNLIGDDEQYAVAMALMARSINAPARVVIGAYPDGISDKNNKNNLPVHQKFTGRQIHAWVEVEFAGFGWIPFDPTPPRENVPRSDQPKPKSVPKPQVLQPPAPPTAPPTLPHVEEQAAAQDSYFLGSLLLILYNVLLYTGWLLIILCPILLIVGAKWWRRRRRLRSGHALDRMRGAWLEALDYGRDCGAIMPQGATRIESGAVLDLLLAQRIYQHEHGKAPSSAELATMRTPTLARDMAAWIDYYTYGPEDTTRKEADQAWEYYRSLVKAFQDHGTHWNNLLVWLLPTSLLQRFVLTRAGRVGQRIPLLGRLLRVKPDPIWSSLRIGSTSQEYLGLAHHKQRELAHLADDSEQSTVFSEVETLTKLSVAQAISTDRIAPMSNLRPVKIVSGGVGSLPFSTSNLDFTTVDKEHRHSQIPEQTVLAQKMNLENPHLFSGRSTHLDQGLSTESTQVNNNFKIMQRPSLPPLPPPLPADELLILDRTVKPPALTNPQANSTPSMVNPRINNGNGMQIATLGPDNPQVAKAQVSEIMGNRVLPGQANIVQTSMERPTEENTATIAAEANLSEVVSEQQKTAGENGIAPERTRKIENNREHRGE